MNKINEFIEEFIATLPIAGQVYDVRNGEKDGEVKIAFYDHFKDYGNYKFVRTVETEFTVDELKPLMVGRSRPVPRK